MVEATPRCNSFCFFPFVSTKKPPKQTDWPPSSSLLGVPCELPALDSSPYLLIEQNVELGVC